MKPNILYLHSHDTGRTIQPYGHAIPTPHLQKLAEQGVLFRQAFCAAPTCSPSRAALLTGQCAHSSGMLGLAHRGWQLNDYQQHIIHTLKPAGYHTALCGVQHVASGPEAAEIIGYDERVSAPSIRARDVAPAAAKWLENAPSQPFFLSVGFIETHTLPDENGELGQPGQPLFGCGLGDARYVRPPAPLPDTPQTRQDMADFQNAAKTLDDGIGQILDALGANGLAENTLVICTTDHGIALPGLKCNLTDHGLGVMLILRGPQEFNGGKVVDAMVSHLDIFPTLCQWLGIEKPTWLQGQSLLPLLRGETEAIHEALFSEVTYHAAYQPQRAVRTSRWKYIRQLGEREKPVMPNVDDSRSKTLWLEHDWRERDVPSEQLYDLMFDPDEACNLASDQSHAQVLAELKTRLYEWMRETDDPILRGPVPLPVGGLATDPDELSP